MPAIPYIKTLNDLANATSSPTQLTLIYFTAAWCGPCKAIAPVVDKLYTLHKDRLPMFKVDVDASKDVAQQYGISAMPTFVVVKGANKIDEMKGANPAGLEALIKKHAAAAAGPGASSSQAGPSEKGLENYSSLNAAVETSQVTCLNESADHTIRHLLAGGGDKWLESDSDEQLLLQIPMQASRIRAIRFKTLASASAQAPKTIRLFVNNPTLGFDDADSLEPAQEIVLTPAQNEGKESVQLRYVRFQNVNCLSIFVKDNQGEEDVSRIDGMELLGMLVDGTDMSQLKKGEDDHEH